MISPVEILLSSEFVVLSLSKSHTVIANQGDNRPLQTFVNVSIWKVLVGIIHAPLCLPCQEK